MKQYQSSLSLTSRWNLLAAGATGLFAIVIILGCGPVDVQNSGLNPASEVSQKVNLQRAVLSPLSKEKLPNPSPSKPEFLTAGLSLSGGPFVSPNWAYTHTVRGDLTWIYLDPHYNHPVIELAVPPTPTNPGDYTVTAIVAMRDIDPECGLVVRVDATGAGYTLSTAWGGVSQPAIGLFDRFTWNLDYVTSGPAYTAVPYTDYVLKMRVADGFLFGKIWNLFSESEPLDWQVSVEVPGGPVGTNVGFYSYGTPSPYLTYLDVN